MRIIKTETWLPASIESVFEFFGNANNLNEITPAWLDFRILNPSPVQMQKGTLLEYSLRVHGIRVRWQTEIIEWDPTSKFVDRQNKGPYRKWVHTHTFEPQDGGTIARDCVEYEVPGWLLEPLIHRFFIEPDLKQIFEYRTTRLKQIFGKAPGSL